MLEHPKLFISYVGARGLVEALAKGVPVIAVPNSDDQLANSRVIEALRAGKSLKDKFPEN